MENPIKNLDWELLRKQKLMLLDIMNKFSLTYFNDQEKEELGDGLINLIDNIQDYAVSEMGVDENIVFDLNKNKILIALEEVRTKVSKDIDTVIFFRNQTWVYMISDTWEFPSFEGFNVDQNILEDALDSVIKLPFIYQIK
jgi:hypothetical protein